MITLRAGQSRDFALSNLGPDGTTPGEIQDNYTSAISTEPTVAKVEVLPNGRTVRLTALGPAGGGQLVVQTRADLKLTHTEKVSATEAKHNVPNGVEPVTLRYNFQVVPADGNLLALTPTS